MLARELKSEGFGVAALHGDMTQTIRNRTMESMRRGKIRILVATDVAARGIDITGVSHVINFDLPRSAEDYVNRIGRTGRASESGVAISFVSHADFSYLERIERYIGQNLNVQVIPGLEPTRALSGAKKSRVFSPKPRKEQFGGEGTVPQTGSPGGVRRIRIDERLRNDYCLMKPAAPNPGGWTEMRSNGP